MSVTHSLDPVDLTNYVYALNSSKFNIPVNSGSVGDVLSLQSNGTSEWIPNPQVKNEGMFYGLTAGTGGPSTSDYASPATVAVKTTIGTGRVPFPRNNGSVDGIVIANSSEDPNDASGLFNSLLLPNAAAYEVMFNLQTVEPGQFNIELTLDGQPVNGNAFLGDLIETVTSNANPTAGGHEYTCNAYITTPVPNCTIAVVNSGGNTPALTIVYPGVSGNTLTHAMSQRFSARQL